MGRQREHAKCRRSRWPTLKLGYERENWGVDLNITNLFDKDYVASCQGINVCSYGEGRSFKLKAHFTW